ncbi:MAG: hypothetical protein K1X79_06875 [Oligoflexia bacterium]|nr:hypothetical protein [Oligoflexia bacterium]
MTTNKFFSSIICALCVCLGTELVVAQTPAIPAAKEPGDLNELAAEMAENTYQVRKSNKNLSSLVQSLEGLIATYCYPDLRQTLRYDSKSISPKCNSLIEKTLSYDPDSPAAICARDGIESRSCREAYQAVQFLVLEPGQSPWFGDNEQTDASDIEAKVSASNSEEGLSLLEAQLSQDESTLRSNPPDQAAIEARIETSSAKLIALSCKFVRLSLKRKAGAVQSESVKNGLPPEFDDPTFQANFNSLSPTEKAQVMEQLSHRQFNPEEAVAPKRPSTPFDEVTGMLFKRATPEPQARQGQTDRMRFVSPACMRYVTRAENVRAALSYATCARWGEYSPQCVDELREDRKRALLKQRMGQKRSPGEAAAPTRKDAGFAKF